MEASHKHNRPHIKVGNDAEEEEEEEEYRHSFAIDASVRYDKERLTRD